MYVLRLILVIFGSGILCPVLANQPAVKQLSGAPAALTHWQSMLGEWSTTEESLKQDGSGWQPTANADWNFYSAMDGWAIRDEYFSPPLAEQISDPNKRQIGTNLRVFDQHKKQWLMAWMAKEGQSINVFTAKSDDEHIVMLAKQKNLQGYFSRITFFAMQADSFEWKMEWSTDGLSNWFEVHRIHGTRKK